MENFLRMTASQKKAYTAAFVISARSVLAQGADEESQEKVQQASQIDDILSTIMKSI
jgi:hypothetical protein